MPTTAAEKSAALAARISRKLGVEIDHDDADTLRRVEKTLSRWAERECGDGSDWHIERNDESRHLSPRHEPGTPFEVYHGEARNIRPRRIADREAGALRRAAEVAGRYGLGIYHQGDPRGCLLYIGRGLTDQTYSSEGVACCD